MRIALIGSGLSSGGLVSMLSDFLRYYPEGEHEVALYCAKSFLVQYPDINSRIKVVVTETLAENRFSQFLRKRYRPDFIRLLDDFCPDAIFYITGTCKRGLEKYKSYIVLNNQLYTSSRRLLRQRSLKVIITTLLFAWTFRHNARHISHVFFSSEYSRTESQGKFCIKDSSVVPFACNSIFYAEKPVTDGRVLKQVNLLNIGSIIPYKNQLVVIEALRILREKGYHFRIQFVGSTLSKGYARLCRKQVARYGLTDDVSFVGWLPSPKIINSIDSCDIFINSSETDTCATAVEEGMARCKPVIASDTPFNREMVRSGGLYFSLQSPSSLAASIIEYMENDELRCQKAISGYNLSKQWTLRDTTKAYYDTITQSFHG